MDLNNFNIIVSLVLLVATFLVVKPLQADIQGLSSSLNRLFEAIDGLRHEITTIQVNTKEVEQIAKSAQKRCDSLESRMSDVELRCINCNCRKDFTRSE